MQSCGLAFAAVALLHQPARMDSFLAIRSAQGESFLFPISGPRSILIQPCRSHAAAD